MLTRAGMVGALVAGLVALPSPAVPAGSAGPTRTCAGLPATIVGTPADDEIVGTEGDDVIVALAGVDRIRDLGGNDVVCGNSGIDGLWSEAGDDLLIGGDGHDTFVFGVGHDRVRGGEGVDGLYALSDGPVRADIRLGPGDEHLRVETLGDAVINTGPGDDQIFVRADPSARLSLIGGEGIDQMGLRFTGEPAGEVFLNQRRARLRIGAGPVGALWGWEGLSLWGNHHWVYRGTSGPDTLMANDGRFNGHTYGGEDVLSVFGPGPHYVHAGAGVMDSVDGTPDVTTCVAVEFGNCMD